MSFVSPLYKRHKALGSGIPKALNDFGVYKGFG